MDRLRLTIVTGMSGAGRSTAAHALEDSGWYVVDNLPASMVLDVCRTLSANGNHDRVAVVVDVRSREMFSQVPQLFDDLADAGVVPEILYLDAVDDVIVRRQDSARRPHPLQGNGRLLDGVHREREMLAELKAAADLVIDTSRLNLHQLATRVTYAFGSADKTVKVTVMSFGFKHGVPIDADVVVDVRFLPNPHWVPELRPQTGLDADVSDFVLAQPAAVPFLVQLHDLVTTMLPGYQREGKLFMTVAIGCTGGKHRSTAMSEDFARRLRVDGLTVATLHRDLELA